MWSNIFVDYSLHRNFNIGFSSHKNNIHLHLSQWQYWWWFWFSLLWSLYFLVIIRTWINKTENFNITANTSLRSHGKWGDFLVSLIPLSWCGNILINSNFILRMIEWQNEASIFTIRVQGKQWYWVYKYNSDINFKLSNVYYNVGNNNWFKSSSLSNLYFNHENSVISFVHDREYKNYFKNSFKKGRIRNKILNKIKFNNQLTDLNFNNTVENNKLNNILYVTFSFKYIDSIFNNKNIADLSQEININEQITELSNYFKKKFNYSKRKETLEGKKEFLKDNYETLRDNKKHFERSYLNNTIFGKNIINKSFFENNQINSIDESDYVIRLQNSNFPIKIIKGILNKQNLNTLNSKTNLKNNLLFNYKISKKNIASKVYHCEQFWGFRQKRYKKLRSYSFVNINKYNNKTYQYVESFINNTAIQKYNLYNSFKTTRGKSELISSTLAKRLLRTKRTLVLPAHINITIITGSYDVVHSWFIPGLGLKMDCVPGRSTHHSLYIDNIGFYYGQCAEICGRYHHHMPIRICALNYNQFLLWWHTRGLPRMYRSHSFLKNKSILVTKFKN
jgi:heme/copper-type cytochrome/quinol oxidase subunit 2